jgi:hypothetical protein
MGILGVGDGLGIRVGSTRDGIHSGCLCDGETVLALIALIACKGIGDKDVCWSHCNAMQQREGTIVLRRAKLSLSLL